MRIWIVIGLLCIASATHAQNVTNFIMYNESGVTEDVKKATDFIVVKTRPDHHFIRLDYKIAGPMKKQRTYKDSALKVLDGPYYEYAADGRMTIYGNYKDNMKDGLWMTFQKDSLLLSTRWSHDSLITEKEQKNDSTISYPDEKEASFPGGLKNWKKYVLKCMKKFSDITINAGGQVVVGFTIETDGSTTDIFLRRSMNYMMDEQSMEAIRKSPEWIPAFQNGKNVKAYRLQPFTFEVQ